MWSQTEINNPHFNINWTFDIISTFLQSQYRRIEIEQTYENAFNSNKLFIRNTEETKTKTFFESEMKQNFDGDKQQHNSVNWIECEFNFIWTSTKN